MGIKDSNIFPLWNLPLLWHNVKTSTKRFFKKIEKTLLYSKEPVYFNKTTIDRRIHDESGAGATGTAAQIAARNANDAKDLNIDDGI